MPYSFVRSFRRSVIGGVALVALLPAAALAQDASADGDAASSGDDIVVTGTLVRGIAPPGANVIGVTAAAIEETGATNVNQVLQTIPQLASFGNLQQPLANSNEVAVNRPNLRSLPGFNTSGGSSTLVLMDGHRLVGMGVTSTSPDPDIIPPGILERVEIVPDGGSAIYGSDAVAGVMNFITIKRFNGVKVDASYGFADDYYQWSANATVGKDWGSGSLYLSYNYSKTDQLVGRDRDYVREFPDSAGYRALACGAGNVQDLVPTGAFPGYVNRGFAGLTGAGGVFGPVNQSCDASDYATVYPESERHSVFAGLTQQLDDSLSFELRGYYTNRKTHILNGPFRTSLIDGANPAAVDTSAVRTAFLFGNGYSGGFTQSVFFQFGANDAARAEVSLETWGVTPTFTKDLGGGFRLRVLGNFGESTTSLISTGFNAKGLKSAVTGGLVNPYNINDPATPLANQTLALISNWETYGRTKQTLYNAKAVLDGDLFTMPGGAVKIAGGFEYAKEIFRAQIGQGVPGFENSGIPVQSINGRPIIFGSNATFGVPDANPTGVAPIPRFDLSRNVKSLFGEVIVPVFSSENAMGGFQQLTLSIAGRYDNYSDFGGTFNPRFGLTWKPVDWLSIHGAWGKSFNAPSLADDENASLNTLFILAGNAARAFSPPASLQGGSPYPNYPTTGATNIVALRGNAPGIRPQTAKTWTVGFDLQPPFAQDLTLSASYYNIDFRDFIGLPPFESPATLYRDYGSVITIVNGNTSFQTLLNNAFAAANIIDNGQTTAPSAATTYAYFDARKQNIGNVKASGIDFSVNYRKDAGFGSIFLSANGTYTLGFKLQPIGGGAYKETITSNNSRFRSRLTVGADIGALTGQVTWNHLHGYTLDPVVGFVPQSRVDSFNTVDLFFRYALKGDGWDKNLALTLNINNVFDQDPPEYRASQQVAGRLGYANGATLGRLVQFGVSKKF